MGSGKSTVGRLLAGMLGWEFVDADAMVVRAAGAPIPRIFRERGERAFRELESAALASLAGRRRVVIATGGGAPTQPENRGFFSPDEGTAVFHLRVSLDTARLRAGAAGDRPLLSLEEDALRALYESRGPVYESLGAGVETDGRDPAQVAEEIASMIRNPNR